jgi:hypothetical protein
MYGHRQVQAILIIRITTINGELENIDTLLIHSLGTEVPGYAYKFLNCNTFLCKIKIFCIQRAFQFAIGPYPGTRVL